MRISQSAKLDMAPSYHGGRKGAVVDRVKSHKVNILQVRDGLLFLLEEGYEKYRKKLFAGSENTNKLFANVIG